MYKSDIVEALAGLLASPGGANEGWRLCAWRGAFLAIILCVTICGSVV